jgi:hypothetical protein
MLAENVEFQRRRLAVTQSSRLPLICMFLRGNNVGSSSLVGLFQEELPGLAKVFGGLSISQWRWGTC